MNLYAYAGNNPVRFSDPFGLCEPEDKICLSLVKELREQKGSEFQDAAGRYESLKGRRVLVLSGTDPKMNINGLNGDGDPESWAGGLTTASEVRLNADLAKGDFLVSAVHESYHFGEGIGGHGNVANDTRIYHGEWRAFNQLPKALRDGAVRTSDQFFHLWGPKYGKHPLAITEPIVKWP